MKIDPRIKIVKKIDESNTDLIICGEKDHFGNSKHTFCAECEKKIVYRPYMPEDVKKVCMQCAVILIDKANEYTITN